MNKLSLLVFVTSIFSFSGCSGIYSYGPKSKVAYAGYTYRNIYIRDPELAFHEVSVDVVRNIEFCIKGRECSRVFDSDDQYMKDVIFIDKSREKGGRKRVFILNVFSKDTNADGYVAGDDLSTIYAYEPQLGKVTDLQEDITYLDLESNVDSFSYFIMYVRDGVDYISQYDLASQAEMKTVVKMQ